MYQLLRSFLFTQDAEWSHDVTIKSLKKMGGTGFDCFYKQNVAAKPVEQFGLTFPNPVGLAAGLDKNGECIDAFAAMGFGFIEVGTVTPRPQAGNDKPRLFRLPPAQAIINRMGFNNKGVDYLVEQVKAAKYDGILGINIGKNKDTPNEEGKNDYLTCLDKVYEHASYVTINISSPNTPGLRNLQYGEALNELLGSIKQRQLELEKQVGKYVPILVKIAPDMSEEEVIQVAETLISNQIDGVIATNTTLARDKVAHLPHGNEAGGLSGMPVRAPSTEVIRMLNQALAGKLPIVGVGGINSAQAAQEKVDAGAKLVQIYTGFIYRGPQLVKEIAEELEI
ncbi:quinone-dependent dihydroorotate dehydrogenase [Catenovulum sp. 2E275]|uniref:quinone-dependent dihydroorotate dehydrogenase n=1 Tax=Catenovulum sp. 2E275 TaxID=2980497 RepID=UPI0021D224B4|nr:quinone-dependent dihydroorotate dehydrogenase [Catenovulum sp. 2E275]MCU4676175.1 quinone-dependent dihydroorotate dehydrogenase [Catenovulum sp. 2E275]